MSIKTTLSDDKSRLNLSIHGVFDFSIVHDFRSCYINLEVIPKTVIIDFRDTMHIDSSALGMLLNLKRYISAGSDDIEIINLRMNVKKILTIAHFEKLFHIH